MAGNIDYGLLNTDTMENFSQSEALHSVEDLQMKWLAFLYAIMVLSGSYACPIAGLGSTTAIIEERINHSR